MINEQLDKVILNGLLVTEGTICISKPLLPNGADTLSLEDGVYECRCFALTSVGVIEDENGEFIGLDMHEDEMNEIIIRNKSLNSLIDIYKNISMYKKDITNAFVIKTWLQNAFEAFARRGDVFTVGEYEYQLERLENEIREEVWKRFSTH